MRRPPPSPSPPRLLPWVVLLAVVVRLALLGWSFAVYPEALRPGPGFHPSWIDDGDPGDTPAPEVPPAERPRLSSFGFEASNVARAWVCEGRGLADPFGQPTGPTAWVSPGVVALYALPFSLFGCYEPAAVVALRLLAVALSAGLTVLAAAAARRLFGSDRIALLAAVLAALSPFDLRLSRAVSTLDLNLHGFLLLLLLYQLLGLHERFTPGRLAGLALTAAVATLCNPVFVVVAAGGLLLVTVPPPLPGGGAGRTPKGRRAPSWPAVGTALLGLVLAQVLVVGPYLVYQHSRLGAWTFVKSNAPFELHLGNLPGRDAVLRTGDFRDHHPSRSPEELRRYRELGEVEYVALQGRRFGERFRPGAFVAATLRRTVEYFFGLHHLGDAASTGRTAGRRLRSLLLAALHGSVGAVFLAYAGIRRFRLRRAELLVFLLALLYAAPHLVTAVMFRYVFPVTPLALLLLAGGAIPFRRRDGTPLY